MQDWYQLTDFDILAEIGTRVKAIRISKKMTQETLAQHCGLNRSTVRDLECGKSITMLSMIQIFRSLDLLSRLEEWLPGPDNSPLMTAGQMQRKRFRRTKM